MQAGTVTAIIIGIIFLVLLVKLLKTPLKWAWKLLINAIGGFFVLVLVNLLGSVLGFSLDINWLNAIVAGILGFPGVVLLLILKYFF